MEQLGSQIRRYRVENPRVEVVAMGDFNVIGESGEYSQSLLPIMELRDTFRNAPCFNKKPSYTCSTNNNLAQRFDACSKDQRLDYVLYSHTNAFEMLPIQADVRTYQVSPPITEDDVSLKNLSDHYGFAAKFSLVR